MDRFPEEARHGMAKALEEAHEHPASGRQEIAQRRADPLCAQEVRIGVRVEDALQQDVGETENEQPYQQLPDLPIRRAALAALPLHEEEEQGEHERQFHAECAREGHADLCEHGQDEELLSARLQKAEEGEEAEQEEEGGEQFHLGGHPHGRAPVAGRESEECARQQSGPLRLEQSAEEEHHEDGIDAVEQQGDDVVSLRFRSEERVLQDPEQFRDRDHVLAVTRPEETQIPGPARQ